MPERLYLHVWEEEVWYLEGPGLPQRTRQTVPQFLQHERLEQHEHVRLLGTESNVSLIPPLFHRRLRSRLSSVQVASPRFLGAEPRDPRQVLQSIRVVEGEAASCGGWHELTARELASYVLADLKPEDEATRRQLLQMHPAWPRLEILPTLDPQAVGRLIGLIRDPRFFTDPDLPDRHGRLRTYLGLEPKIQRAVRAGQTGLLEDRNRLVQQCWCREDTAADHTHPSAFLQREYVLHADPDKAALRTSQLFLQYLVFVWLDALYPNPPWGEPLFLPGHFFRQADEVEWFNVVG